MSDDNSLVLDTVLRLLDDPEDDERTYTRAEVLQLLRRSGAIVEALSPLLIELRKIDDKKKK